MVEAEPSYMMFNTVAFLIGVAYERAVNVTDWLAGLRVNIQGTAHEIGRVGIFLRPVSQFIYFQF